MEKRVIKILKQLGVPIHMKGYNYLVDAIEICSVNPTVSMTKELYVDIASKHKDLPSRVERAIRYAVEVGWLRADLGTVQKIFGNSIDSNKCKPTNSQFCKGIANYLKYDLGDLND